MNKRLFWLLPLVLLAIIAAVIIALPSFVASRAHRATIEALASSLTGRQVHIGGKLSLALFPAPQLIAGDITIGGPQQETITAHSLTLDIAVPALLEGQLSARNLTLQSPEIDLPWPLPGGAAAVAPPRWLTTLHAQISNGTVSLGGLRFAQINADVFTGGDSAVSVSGSFGLADRKLSLSLSLGAADATGVASLTVDASDPDTPPASAHFSGTLNAAGEVAGALNFTGTLPGASAPAGGHATILADANGISLTGLQIQQQTMAVSGTAKLDFAGKLLSADLAAANLDLGQLTAIPRENAAGINLQITLNATNAKLGGVLIPQLKAEADLNADGLSLHNLDALLPGNSELNLSAQLAPNGPLTGNVSLTSTATAGLLAGLGSNVTLPAAWTQIRLTSDLAGDASHVALVNMTGTLGTSKLSGGISFSRNQGRIAAAGALHFEQLDFAPLWALVKNLPQAPGFTWDGEITADKANFAALNVTHLLLDTALDQKLVVRRIAANVDGGVAAASFTIGSDRQVTAGRALLSIPSAAPLLALAPAWAQLPAVIAAAPLDISLRANGAATALAASAVVTLGNFTLTAAPVLDITAPSATGALTLRHPDAIAALAAFGLTSNLAWPGAGSIALRADMAVSPGQAGLPDFVLSLGDLTANGRLLLTANHSISGEIDAGNLALPPVTAKFTLPWAPLATLTGKIGLTTDQIWLGGADILGQSAATLAFAPPAISLNIAHMQAAGGNLSGLAAATISATAAPALTAKLSLTGANLSSINLPIDFPLTAPAGIAGGQANLAATGYDFGTWRATLSGGFSISASKGNLNGFSLAGITQALSSPNRAAALHTAATSGATPFGNLTIAGTLDHGNLSLTNATLQGPDGNATATGSIDIPDRNLALTLNLLPNVTPPLKIGVATLGSWTSPKKIPALKPALTWQAPKPNE